MSAKVEQLTDQTFAAGVKDGLVLVDFWAEWCMPCRAVAPVIEQLSAEYAGRVRFAKLNVDAAPETASLYGIRSIPTIALFRDGIPVTGVAGAVPKPVLAGILDEHLPADV